MANFENPPAQPPAYRYPLIFLPTLLLCVWPNPYLAAGTVLLILVGIGQQLAKGTFKPNRSLIIPLILFAASATVGVWSGYQFEQAIIKWLILLLAVLFALLLVNEHGSETAIITYLAAGSSLFAMIFLSVSLLNIDQGELLTPNRLAGLAALLAPFLIASFLNTASTLKQGLIAAGGLCVGAALLASGSRGGIVSLMIGLAFWAILHGKLPWVKNEWRKPAVICTLFALIAVGAAGLYTVDRLAASPIQQIPGSGSRITLYANMHYLLSDYWLLGSGLNSFGGHYSRYILSIPHLRFTYGHNLYFDLTLEQGIIGLIAFVWLVCVTLTQLMQQSAEHAPSESRYLSGAILASLTTLILHGFIDDAVYGNVGSTLLFLPSALAFTLPRSQPTVPLTRKIGWAILAGLVITTILFNKAVLSRWHSNLAAINMAKVELATWPTGKWSQGEFAEALEPLLPTLERALEQDGGNSSAHYRLGLIHMEKHAFPAAADSLAQAHALDPDHIGIRKNLGYALLWSGRPEEAKPYLERVEGIQNELDAYVWWWQALDRPDLSDLAKQMKNAS